jgi:hypothetical protein
VNLSTVLHCQQILFGLWLLLTRFLLHGFSPFFPKNSFPKTLLNLMGFWKSSVCGGNMGGAGVVSSRFLRWFGLGTKAFLWWVFGDSRISLWRPRFLINHNNPSTLLTVVKSRSTWVLTLKTSPTNPNDPIDQVHTHVWSNFGQIHGQTLPKPYWPWMSYRTFVAFSKFHLNTSKSTNMKVVQFLLEEGGNLSQLTAPPVTWHWMAFKLWVHFMQILLRKTPYGLYETCRG